ncbi:acyl CoA binding protein-domain-containing protein [Cladochytrium replicatum]|nr:acyl CoA binding protein-domain-containing protein [Cladochytrium replicatum]
MSSLDEEFDAAATAITNPTTRLGTAKMLQLYGLYKYSQQGPCTTSRPSMFDPTGRAKWDAYSALGKDMSTDDAKRTYVDLVRELVGGDSPGKTHNESEDDDEVLLLTARGMAVSTLAKDADDDVPPEDRTIFDWCAAGDVENVIQLLDKDPGALNVTPHDSRGAASLLHIAVDQGNDQMVRVLLERGAEVGVRDDVGQTPLHYASLLERVDICKILLDRGADPSAVDHDGITPLQLVRESSESYQSLRELLQPT